MSHISLFLWERTRTYCKHIHTAVLRSTSSFWGYTSKYSTAIYEVYSGEGRIRCFLGKVRSSPSGTSLAENRAPSGLFDVCCCEDQITDSGGSTQTGARTARKTAEQQQQSLHYRYFYPYEYVVRYGPILTNKKYCCTRYGPILTNKKYCCTFRMYVEERLYRKGKRRV